MNRYPHKLYRHSSVKKLVIDLTSPCFLQSAVLMDCKAPRLPVSIKPYIYSVWTAGKGHYELHIVLQWVWRADSLFRKLL